MAAPATLIRPATAAPTPAPQATAAPAPAQPPTASPAPQVQPSAVPPSATVQAAQPDATGDAIATKIDQFFNQNQQDDDLTDVP